MKNEESNFFRADFTNSDPIINFIVNNIVK